MTNEDKILALLSSMAQSMESMREDYKSLDSKIDTVEKSLGERIDDLRSEMNEKFARVDERFDRIENDIRNINSRELHIMEIASKGRRTA